MAVEFETKEFSRVGRKTEGEEASKYTARQIKEGTVYADTPEGVFENCLTVVDGDLKKLATYFETGANTHLRLEAGGYDEWQKAAKKILADKVMSAMPMFKGKTLEQVVEFLKAQA